MVLGGFISTDNNITFTIEKSDCANGGNNL